MLIVVVDDGSGAEFSEVFESASKIDGVLVLQNAVNLGKGAALKHGLNYILTHFTETQWVITADADGQHLPVDIQSVAAASESRTLVLGSRSFDKNVPFRSQFGNTVSRYVYRFLTGIYLRDTQSGLRSIPKRLAELCLSIRSNRYEFETEELVLAKLSGFSLKEVPIETVYIDNNRGSHFDPVFDSFRIYFVLIRYAATSVATAVTDFLVFLALLTSGLSLFNANMAARAVALWLQFMLLKKYVFKSGAGLSTFAIYVAYVFATGYVSVVLQHEFVVYVVNVPILAKAAVETAIFTFNFLFLRDIIFRKWSEAE